MKRQCGDCKFFDAFNDQSKGNCRIDPPTVLVKSEAKPGSSSAFTAWPLVHQTEWCGSFEADK